MIYWAVYNKNGKLVHCTRNGTPYLFGVRAAAERIARKTDIIKQVVVIINGKSI